MRPQWGGFDCLPAFASFHAYQTPFSPSGRRISFTPQSSSCSFSSCWSTGSVVLPHLKTHTRAAWPVRQPCSANRIIPRATGTESASESSVAAPDVAVILLAGGVGSRMKADRPKQFLELNGQTVLEYSLELFSSLSYVSVIVLVIDESYRSSFRARCDAIVARRDISPRIIFANPGVERQDSVLSGLAAAEREAGESDTPVSLVAIHDSARPLVTKDEVGKVVADARAHGAAVLGVPCKATVKESADGEHVLRTIPRSRLWEVQTPQVIKPDSLRRGFDYVEEKGLAVTDDVSVVEHLGEPVRITLGEYSNIKITTPEDLDIATSILRKRAAAISH